MTTPPVFPLDVPDYETHAVQNVLVMADNLGRTICIARALVENGRSVDLTGLDLGVGLLCAKALDLPADNGRAIRPYLVNLLAEADALSTALKISADCQ